MTFFRRVSVGVLAAGLAMTLGACTININSEDPSPAAAAPLDEDKAQVLACKVYYDHYLEPLRAAGDQTSRETYPFWIAHNQAALDELSALPGEVAGVLTLFHADQLDYYLWVKEGVDSGREDSAVDDFARWSSAFKVPSSTNELCRQFE